MREKFIQNDNIISDIQLNILIDYQKFINFEFNLVEFNEYIHYYYHLVLNSL